jgi:ubiquinone/menaquinone biosynthesis C-methylase UbiE
MTSAVSRRTLSLLLVTLLVPIAATAQRAGSVKSEQMIFNAIAVRDGITACEIGAGDGELSIAAARAVGPNGRVFTSELGDARLKTLQEKIAAANLAQITVVTGDAGKANFPDGACDAVFMRDVYHHFTDPASMNASISVALKPGGRVAIVDFTPPGKEATCPADRDNDGMHGISPESVSREMKGAGLEQVSSEIPSQRWFMVVFSKPRT